MNKNIIIAGAIAVGLYLFSHTKKSIPMTRPAMWRDMTPAQRAAYIRRTTLTTMADKIKALKEARKQKSADENTPLGETKLSPEEREAVILALEAEKEQGTGFDYIRERNPPTPAVPVEKRKHASILKSAERQKEENRRREEQIAAEWEASQEEESRKQIETQEAYKNELLKDVKPKDQEQSKKKTEEEILKLFGLWSLPTAPPTKPKPKLRHIVTKKISRIRPAVRRLISTRRSVSKPKWKPHVAPKKRIITKIRPAVRRLISARRPMSKLRRR